MIRAWHAESRRAVGSASVENTDASFDEQVSNRCNPSLARGMTEAQGQGSIGRLCYGRPAAHAAHQGVKRRHIGESFSARF